MPTTLVVCEKPDAASRVAKALDRHGQPSRQQLYGVPYYDCESPNGPIIVCSAIGHLYTLDSKGRIPRRFYPVWDFQWRAKNQVEPRKSGRLRSWIIAIESLAKKADRFVNACDYDLEGALIGQQILQHACKGADAKAQRMKFSTMTEKELQESYLRLSPRLDFGFANAGRCRHELDWLYGINLSRVLTMSVVKSGRGYSTISTGRVQGPTLKFVVEREHEIGAHVPAPFWTIDAKIKPDDIVYNLDFEKERLETLEEARRIVQDCANSLLQVSRIESRETRQSPPYPFDLSTLQSESYRHFGYSPSRTLSIAERLYLDALISYPRTSSQRLPPDINYRNILEGLSRQNAEYTRLVNKLFPNSGLNPTQGSKDDPAHPAVYPTGEKPRMRLAPQEARVLDLISRRFMSAFARPSIRQSSRMTLETLTHKFYLHGSRLVEAGWTEFYRPYVKDEEQRLPALEEGSKVPMLNIRFHEKFTEPPARYNPASLLRKMEDENLGTKATRAEIIEILYRRNYLREQRMQATPLAVQVISILNRHCPLIVDPRFTAHLEDMMGEIETGSSSRRRVLAEAIEHLRPVMLDIIKREEMVGTMLGETVMAQRVLDVTFSTACPQCSQQLKIVRSRTTGKRFIGHVSGWEGTDKCRFSAPLPQFGTLTILNKACPECGFQMIQARTPGRRPLISCPSCYSRKAQQKTGGSELNSRSGGRTTVTTITS